MFKFYTEDMRTMMKDKVEEMCYKAKSLSEKIDDLQRQINELEREREDLYTDERNLREIFGIDDRRNDDGKIEYFLINGDEI